MLSGVQTDAPGISPAQLGELSRSKITEISLKRVMEIFLSRKEQKSL